MVLISGRRPEPPGGPVVIADDRVDSDRSALPQTTLGVMNEPCRHPGTPVVGIDGESVQAPAPTVPGRDDRPDHLTARLRDQQSLLVSLDETEKSGNVVRDGYCRPCPAPQLEHLGAPVRGPDPDVQLGKIAHSSITE